MSKYTSAIIITHNSEDAGNTVTTVPLNDLGYAVDGLKVIQNDSNYVVWMDNHYTVIATKMHA